MKMAEVTKSSGGSSVRRKPVQMRRPRKTEMIWVMLGVLCLGSGSGGDEGGYSDVVRRGATLISRMLESPNFFSSVFYNLPAREGESRLLQVLKLLGMDSTTVEEFAFDGMISIVRLIYQVLPRSEGRRTEKKAEDFSFLSFVLNQAGVRNFLSTMQDPDLVKKILGVVEGTADIECIKVLICRTQPFVRGMQRSLRFFERREKRRVSGMGEVCQKEEGCVPEEEEDISWEEADMEGRMFFFMPTLEEVVEVGEECDRLYPHCEY